MNTQLSPDTSERPAAHDPNPDGHFCGPTVAPHRAGRQCVARCGAPFTHRGGSWLVTDPLPARPLCPLCVLASEAAR